jgi:hypothetical protein
MKIFYSWESDIKYQKNQIEKSITKAIKKISKELEIEIALDRDTKNTSGSTDIADEILRKINSSSIFIADISFINTKWYFPLLKMEKTVNQNVLIELGYAVRKIGFDRIIMVFNNKYGKVEELPFDLRHRRVLSYSDPNTELDQDVYLAIKEISDKGEYNIVPNRDLDESHDIEVFMRICSDISEENLEPYLNHIASTGFYKYSDTDFIVYKNDMIKLPKNKFIHPILCDNAYRFGEACDKLSLFLAKNCFCVRDNIEVGRINQFEGEVDYNERSRKTIELHKEFYKHTQEIVQTFTQFRLSVNQILRI